MANETFWPHIDSKEMSLKEIDKNDVRPEIENLLLENEEIFSAFQVAREQVIFTNSRIFIAKAQGWSGNTAFCFSYPYSKIQYYGLETSVSSAVNKKLVIAFHNGESLQFTFEPNVDVETITTFISKCIL